MTARSTTVASLALATVALGACLGPRKDAMVAGLSQRHERYDVPMNTAVVLDQVLTRTLLVERTGSRRSESNTLVAWASLRNRTDETIKVSARARFFGADRQPLEESAWSLVYIDRRGLGTFEVPSTRPDAAYYYVEIMAGR